MVKSSACIDISNCSGSTSFLFLFRISFSCLARLSSLCATTSSCALTSASSKSTGQPASAMFFVIWFATSSLSLIKCAGWHNSCLSECQRKSRSNNSVFPSQSLVPRPTICEYNALTFVGLNTTTQSTLGQSQPSVNSIELHNTLYFPLSKSCKTSVLLSLPPFTSTALNPNSFKICVNF